MTVLGAPLAVRLPAELRERVAQLAAVTRRSQGDVIREVLERDLSRLEFEHRVISRVADVRAGRAQTVTLKELNDDLGDLGPVDMSTLDDVG